MTKRHLHLDYSTSYCGKDISHLLATWDEADATCAACLKRVPVVAKRRAAEAQRIVDAEKRQQREHQEDMARRAAESMRAAKESEERIAKLIEEAAERAVNRAAQRGPVA